MKNQKTKDFYIVVKGQKITVSEEVYRAFVRPIRAQQRKARRDRKCKVKGERLGLVRCKENCSVCPYATDGNTNGAELSLEGLIESGYEVPSDVNIEENFILQEEYSEKAAALRKGIQILNERQKFIVKEIYFKGKSKSAVAKQLGIHPSALSQALHRILDKLKKFLQS